MVKAWILHDHKFEIYQRHVAISEKSIDAYGGGSENCYNNASPPKAALLLIRGL